MHWTERAAITTGVLAVLAAATDAPVRVQGSVVVAWSLCFLAAWSSTWWREP